MRDARQPIAAVLAAALAAAAAGAAAGAELAPAVEGLWHGKIFYEPAAVELETTIEIGADAQGRLIGTLGMPSQHIEYLPVSAVEHAGRSLAVTFHWDSETRGPDAPFYFRGELSADGAVYAGEFTASDVVKPFRLERLGPPGTPWPLVADPPPLADLSPSLVELRDAFNADPGAARLILLLSPT